jgi:hypothetical protein
MSKIGLGSSGLFKTRLQIRFCKALGMSLREFLPIDGCSEPSTSM